MGREGGVLIYSVTYSLCFAEAGGTTQSASILTESVSDTPRTKVTAETIFILYMTILLTKNNIVVKLKKVEQGGQS